MQTDNVFKSDATAYADGHNFEDAVQALEKQLADGVKSALHEPSYTVEELKRELGI